ncbi:hypothetical protein PsAD26_01113 [Pseudovibrio sp. Ad26]|nr:hypothetical protein PsAD26_01113 [Pseudovibrio sp. Ad26]
MGQSYLKFDLKRDLETYQLHSAGSGELMWLPLNSKYIKYINLLMRISENIHLVMLVAFEQLVKLD